MSPLLTIARGGATDEELAALTASIMALAASAAAAPAPRTMPSAPPPASAWLGRAAGWRQGWARPHQRF
ncbi:MAG: hypothetical protein LBO20_08965 [Bifidobacteriaceae bacterium]|nr:hypothetical protein [Bifidobacteriaceae bacterium]